MCKCWDGWTGISCEGKICPYGRAWGGELTASNLHGYAECSNVGECDRKTGLCKCMEGFTGQGCRRSVCPKMCSGHGYCRDIVDMAKDTNPLVGGRWDRSYSVWDARKSRVCRCDSGYTGADCSLRQCPRGDDVMTNHTVYYPVLNSDGPVVHVVQKDEVQRLRVAGVGDLSGTFTLTHVDALNGSWTTRPIRFENNVGTETTVMIHANNAGSYFAGATYVQRVSPSPAFGCPFNDPACAQECPFGMGYKIGDKIEVTADSQNNVNKFFTITAKDPCKITVTPAPVGTTTAEPTIIRLVASTAGGEVPFVGLEGVREALKSLPNRIIPDITVSERELGPLTQPGGAPHNAKREFDVTFSSVDTSGDQHLLTCNPLGCDEDGCQPRYKGLLKSVGRITLNTNANDIWDQYIQFSIVGTNGINGHDDTIQLHNTDKFLNRVVAGDRLLITGTNANDGLTYTVNTVSMDGRTVTVNEDILTAELYTGPNDVHIDVSRYFGAGAAQFDISVAAGGAPSGGLVENVISTDNQIRFSQTSEQEQNGIVQLQVLSTTDLFKDVLVGDLVKMKANDDSKYDSHENVEYEVIGVDVEVHIVAPLEVSATSYTSAFDIMREAGSCNVTELVKGTKENEECGSRGLCDRKLGVCNCFPGFAGSSCSEQEVHV